ncbi:hypothetical protein KGQ71_01395 [Patescibacteria group bacterium]|nr:hypothetical protein [Patescibacteria group bacterium]
MKAATYFGRLVGMGAVLCSVFLIGAGFAQAAAPQLSSGQPLTLDKPYSSAQTITDVISNKEVFGKLQGSTPIDIYSVTPDRDGEQTFSLLSPQQMPGQAALIFVDPTTASQAQNLGLPLPESGNYHTALVKAPTAAKTYYETALFQNFDVLAQGRYSLKKGVTYYLVVLDPYRQTVNYALKLGESSSWTAGDVFRNFGTWIRLQTNDYAGTSPFTFSWHVFKYFMMLLSLSVLVGIFFIEQLFAFMANKSKAAGYILIKMQPFSKVFIWSGLALMAIFSYLFFRDDSWLGIPFVMFLVFIPLLISLLYQTIVLSPRVAALEVTKKEATIPFALRKRWFFSFLVSFFSLGAILVFFGIYFTK